MDKPGSSTSQLQGSVMEASLLQSSRGTSPERVCCISLHETDKLRVINFPTDLQPAFRMALQKSWSKGIQSEKAYGRSYEFKLHGYPWNGAGSEAVESRRLATGIMRFMVSHGWGLELVTDLSKKDWDKDSWFFRKQIDEPDAVMCSISFNMTDRIRIIDGFPELTEAVLLTIKNHWHLGLQEQRNYCGVPEFKLYGNPWLATGREIVHTRLLVMELIDALRNLGWIVYASVDISCGHGDARADLDSWILKKFKR